MADGQEITLGEVYRLQLQTQQSVESMRNEMKTDRHELRNDLNKLAVAHGALQVRVSAVEVAQRDAADEQKTQRRDISHWLVALISGLLVAAADWIFARMAR